MTTAMQHLNRCAEQCTGTGLTDPEFSGYVDGYRAITDTYAGNQLFSYLLLDGDGFQWEIGIGRYSGTTFSRDYIIDSSDYGAQISLSSATHEIRVVASAHQCAAVMSTGATPKALALGDVALGGDAVAEGGNSTALGNATVTRGDSSVAIGNGATTLYRNKSIAIGHNATASTVDHTIALGANCDAQIAGAFHTGDGLNGTHSGTAFEWSGTAVSSGTTAQGIEHATGTINLPTNAVAVLDILVAGRRTAPSNAWCGLRLTAVIHNVSGTPTIVGSVTKTTIGVTGGAAPDCNLTIASGAIKLAGQGGASGETWYWSATARGTLQRGST